MTPVTIWVLALLAYLLFRWWYDNWSGPLTAAEIEEFMAKLPGLDVAVGNDPEVIRAFLEADDGREFVMVNLVKAQLNPVLDPASGQQVPGLALFKRYARRFMSLLLRRGGHPGMVGRKVGGYLDTWNVEPDPDWTIVGLTRYRSRRDLMKLVTDPAFQAAHPEKLLGTLATFSFPAQRMVSLYLGPRISVALVLALLAAVGHLVVLQSQ
jgi:hypothetical protein